MNLFRLKTRGEEGLSNAEKTWDTKAARNAVERLDIQAARSKQFKIQAYRNGICETLLPLSRIPGWSCVEKVEKETGVCRVTHSLEVIEHQAKTNECPDCHQVSVGEFPQVICDHSEKGCVVWLSRYHQVFYE